MLKFSKILALLVVSTLTAGSAAVPVLCLNNKTEEDDIILPKELLQIEDDSQGNVILKGLSPEATPRLMFGKEYNKIVIPEEVTEIAPFAFAYHFDYSLNLISRIDFSQAINLKKIGDNAFNFCHKLECDIDLSNSPQLQYIGSNAFFYCLDIKSFTFNNSVENLIIGDHAFAYCESITNITIPAGVEEIKDSAFSKCVKLNRIDMSDFNLMPPWLLTSTWLFDNAGSTSTTERNAMVVNLTNTSFDAWDNILRKNQELGDKWDITSPHATTEDDFEYDSSGSIIVKIKDSTTNIDALVIPKKANGIADNAFLNKFITGSIPLIMGSEITKIGENAFSGCGGLVGNLSLPARLNTLGKSAFEGCKNLKGIINLPTGITALDDEVFKDSGIEGIIFTNKLQTLGKNVFTGCYNLALIDVSCYEYGSAPTTTVTTGTEKPLYGLNGNGYMYLLNTEQPIKEQWYTNFQSLGMSNDQLTQAGTDINCWTFHLKDEKVSKVLPDDAYNSINNSDLRGFKEAYSSASELGKYGQIQIPSTTKTIGYEAFYEKLKSPLYKWHLTLNEGLQTIQERAFLNDTSLYGDLIIPNTVRTIESQAFYGCSGLQGTLLLPESIESLGEHLFENMNFSRIILPASMSASRSIGRHCFVIGPATKVLDFSKLQAPPFYPTGGKPFIYFKEESSGIIYVKDLNVQLLWAYYFTNEDCNFNTQNWQILVKE